MASDDGRVRFHGWLQWLARRQLDSVTATTRLVQDLPIGFDRDGMDAWVWQDLLAPGVTVGAPPDEFNPAGQDWGLPPFVPGPAARRWLRAVHRDDPRDRYPGAAACASTTSWGCFGCGGSPTAPARPTAPTCATRSTTCSTSWRWKAFVHEAVVVGEDLGTVEPGVREELAARRLLSYRLLWFEEDPPSMWPAQAMAAITTHDLPTVRGLWDGSDVATLHRLDVPTNEEAMGAHPGPPR